jgi:hypothetical protein
MSRSQSNVRTLPAECRVANLNLFDCYEGQYAASSQRVSSDKYLYILASLEAPRPCPFIRYHIILKNYAKKNRLSCNHSFGATRKKKRKSKRKEMASPLSIFFSFLLLCIVKPLGPVFMGPALILTLGRLLLGSADQVICYKKV